MKRIISISLIIVLVMLHLLGCSNGNGDATAKPLTQEQRIEDFNYLFNVIKDNYPFLEVNKRMNGIDWVGNYDAYLERVSKTNSDLEFVSAINIILRELNNNHTHLLNRSSLEWMRQVYSDRLPQQEVRCFRTLIFEELAHDLVSQRYGLPKLSIEEVMQREPGKEIDIKSNPLTNALVEDIVEGKVGYIYVPRMIQQYERELDEDLIKEYLSTIKNHQALIIDIRGNGGGDTSYWFDFLLPLIVDKEYVFESYFFYRDGEITNKFKEFESQNDYSPYFYEVNELDYHQFTMLPPEVNESFGFYIKTQIPVTPAEESIRFTGNIYLLVDGNVFSASEMLAAFAKDTGLATLVGSRTAGDGIGHDPWITMLPNSGLLLRFPLVLGTTSDGTVNEEHKTTPHYEVVATRSPARVPSLSRDFAIQKVLELEGIDY